MAKFEWNIEEIYGSIASYKGLPFPSLDISREWKYQKDKWRERAELIAGERRIEDMYGRPVKVPVVLDGIQLGGADENKDILLQPLVIIEGKKDIVKTKIEGGSYNGTIKEFINYDDYKVKIMGPLISIDQKVYPYKQWEILRKIWKKNEALSFECSITNDLFEHIVFEKLKLHELKKSPGFQMYEMEGYSDGYMEVEFLKAIGQFDPGKTNTINMA